MREIKFRGKRVDNGEWIEGIGIIEINDRGGMVGDGHIDVAMESRAAALRFGRQTRRVVVL